MGAPGRRTYYGPVQARGWTGRIRRGLVVLAAGSLLAACAADVPGTVVPAAPPRPTVATGPSTPTTGPTDGPTTGPTDGPTDGPTTDPTDGPPGSLGSSATRSGRGSKDTYQDAELVSLGEDLTAALASGDVEQWLALTTLSGEPEQQQRDWFAAVEAVPMELREMHPTAVLEPDAEGEVDGPVVEFGFRHQVTGADPEPSLEYYELTLEREGTDGPYKVVAVGGTSAQRTAYPQVWDTGPVTVLQGDHIVLLAPEQDTGIADLLPSLDIGAGKVLEALPVDGVSTMVVTAVDQEQLASLMGGAEVGQYAGYTNPTSASPTVRGGSGLPELETGGDRHTARIVVDRDYVADELDYFGDLPAGDPLMRHEGLHLAMQLGIVGGYPPPWASEGMAGWFEVNGEEQTREDHLTYYRVIVDTQGEPTALPPNSGLEFFADDAVDRNYIESAAVFLYMEQEYGYDATLAVGRQLHEMGLLDDEDDAIDEAFREHLGVGREQFEKDWIAWVKSDVVG